MRPLDVNSYATKKTVAQGMMDIALLTANANQLRYVLESGSTGGFYYYFNITLISFSIILQVSLHSWFNKIFIIFCSTVFNFFSYVSYFYDYIFN